MTKKQMLAECRRLAPDFTLTVRTTPGNGPCVVAACTIDGRAHELSHVIGAGGRARFETLVLEGSLTRLRRSHAA